MYSRDKYSQEIYKYSQRYMNRAENNIISYKLRYISKVGDKIQPEIYKYSSGRTFLLLY